VVRKNSIGTQLTAMLALICWAYVTWKNPGSQSAGKKKSLSLTDPVPF